MFEPEDELDDDAAVDVVEEEAEVRYEHEHISQFVVPGLFLKVHIMQSVRGDEYVDGVEEDEGVIVDEHTAHVVAVGSLRKVQCSHFFVAWRVDDKADELDVDEPEEE